MAGDKGWWSREVMFRAAVDPLRCPVHASRPGVAMPGHPFDACVSPLDAAGNASLRFTPGPMTLRTHLGTIRTLFPIIAPPPVPA
jgi:hypothetical protein